MDFFFILQLFFYKVRLASSTYVKVGSFRKKTLKNYFVSIRMALQVILWLTLATFVYSSPLSAIQTESSSHQFPPTVTLTPAGHHHPRTVFVGRSLPDFKQDLFLGIKYADQPARFTPSKLKRSYTSQDSNSGVYHPSTLDESVQSDSRSKTVYYNATQYGYDCPGYGSDTTKLVDQGLVTLHEDCLNLNIIRPQHPRREGSPLPVMLWIFGGGWTQGATADPRWVFRKLCLFVLFCQGIYHVLISHFEVISCRYNMSYVVQQSALNGKPVLGVSINYRLSAFGFLDSKEVRVCEHREDNTLLDLIQR